MAETLAMPKVGGTYRHYKGTEYKILAIAKHSETEEEMVIYQDTLHPEKIWARPVAMFMEEIEWEGKRMPRFIYLG